eukprot:GHVH01007366.1.p3 GENE.GHVH01007366.1~~GHVH01007366.1.p3  ORF type:complete len:164 (+),score=26.97 GHVH01007366.1:53-544(+)
MDSLDMTELNELMMFSLREARRFSSIVWWTLVDWSNYNWYHADLQRQITIGSIFGAFIILWFMIERTTTHHTTVVEHFANLRQINKDEIQNREAISGSFKRLINERGSSETDQQASGIDETSCETLTRSLRETLREARGKTNKQSQWFESLRNCDMDENTHLQ